MKKITVEFVITSKTYEEHFDNETAEEIRESIEKDLDISNGEHVYVKIEEL